MEKWLFLIAGLWFGFVFGMMVAAVSRSKHGANHT